MKYLLILLFAFSLPVDSAAQKAKELVYNLQQSESDSLKIAAWHQLVRHYRYADMDSALLYAAEGLAYARSVNYTYGEAMMHYAMGEVNERHGELELAKEQYTEARHMFRQIGYTRGIAASTNGLGIVAGRTSQYDEATMHFLDALKLYEQIGETEGIMQTYIKLGVVSDYLEDLDKALEYYLKAEALNGTPMSLNARLTLLNNIGVVYGKRNEIPTALRYFHKGLRESDPDKTTAIHITLLSSLGIAHEKSNRPDSAYYFQQQALSMARQHSLPEEEARALVNLASLLSTTDVKQSFELLQLALAISNRIQQLSLTSEVYELMIQLYKKEQNFREALELSETRQLLKDSLFSLQKSKEIARLHASQELARKQNEIRSLALMNEKSTTQRNILIVVAVVFFVLIGIVWYYNHRISALNKRLISKQHELSNSNTIKDKIFSVLGHDLRSPLGRILGLLNILDLKHTSEDESRIIENLRQQSMNTLETLDSLLLWGQSQLKGMRLNQQVIPLKTQLSKSVQLTADYALQKNINIIETTPAGLHAFADPAHFDFVVRNLLSNAIKFSHSGSEVAIHAFARKDKIVVSIHDTGIGIPEHLHEEIFTSDTESARGTWNEKGNGIALMLCREYIAENGGKLWVESEPGKGSMFCFSLLQARDLENASPEEGDGRYPLAHQNA